MTQEIANFFVSEARKNQHRARSINEEDELLVYNFVPHFTGIHDATVGGGEDLARRGSAFIPLDLNLSGSRARKLDRPPPPNLTYAPALSMR